MTYVFEILKLITYINVRFNIFSTKKGLGQYIKIAA